MSYAVGDCFRWMNSFVNQSVCNLVRWVCVSQPIGTLLAGNVAKAPSYIVLPPMVVLVTTTQLIFNSIF